MLLCWACNGVQEVVLVLSECITVSVLSRGLPGACCSGQPPAAASAAAAVEAAVLRCSRCDILCPGPDVRVSINDIQRSIARTDRSTKGLLLLCLLYFEPMAPMMNGNWTEFNS